MQLNLKINGVNFAQWAKEDGIVQSTILRQSRSIVVLNGNLYKSEIEKRKIDIQLVEVRDKTLSSLMLDITPRSTVEYTDIKHGDRTAIFYVTVTGATAKRVVGGNTYYSGVSIELEEM